MNGPPGCPAATPAGWYASTAFVGTSSLLPFTFTLPDGWRVQAASFGLVVNCRTRGRTVVTIVSNPVAADLRLSLRGRRGPGLPVPPEQLLGRLARRGGIDVSNVERPSVQDGPWWWTADLTSGLASGQPGCGREASCLPVLVSAYDHRRRPYP